MNKKSVRYLINYGKGLALFYTIYPVDPRFFILAAGCYGIRCDITKFNIIEKENEDFNDIIEFDKEALELLSFKNYNDIFKEGDRINLLDFSLKPNLYLWNNKGCRMEVCNSTFGLHNYDGNINWDPYWSSICTYNNLCKPIGNQINAINSMIFTVKNESKFEDVEFELHIFMDIDKNSKFLVSSSNSGLRYDLMINNYIIRDTDTKLRIFANDFLDN